MAHRPHRPHNFRALSKPKNISKGDHRHYWPYIPLLLLVLGTFLLSLAPPVRNHGVLAYSTNLSTDALLQATNTQRQQNHASTLSLNTQLTNAAQAKASDMIARNYWSHVTPDGQQPWKFIDTAGYKYMKAGENLAYGFASNNETITGWMNSPAHRENLLDTSFTEVGFGYASGENFNHSGEETVVVAMYGKPQVQAVSNLSAALPPAQPASFQRSSLAVNSDNANSPNAATRPVARIQTFTTNSASWMVFVAGLVTGLALMFLLVKHIAGLRHVIKNSERLILHHPLLDIALVSMVLIGSFLSQTTGFIR